MLNTGPIEQSFQKAIDSGRKLFLVLLDPDAESPEKIVASGINAAKGGADAILIGGSFMGNPLFGKMSAQLKKETGIPLVLFPGGASQVSAGPDAIFFTTLVSGRNPQFLIEEQVRGAFAVLANKMEPIPTAYILIESGKTTAVEYISNTRPIPADKPRIAAAHALAAQMMGQRWAYLEAGSGAEFPVPPAVVQAVSKTCRLNIITGGGIKTPEAAAERARAGAHAIVIGNHFEQNKGQALFQAFSDAIHGS